MAAAPDPEFLAIKRFLKILGSLTKPQQRRVMQYVIDKSGVNVPEPVPPPPTEPGPA